MIKVQMVLVVSLYYKCHVVITSPSYLLPFHTPGATSAFYRYQSEGVMEGPSYLDRKDVQKRMRCLCRMDSRALDDEVVKLWDDYSSLSSGGNRQIK